MKRSSPSHFLRASSLNSGFGKTENRAHLKTSHKRFDRFLPAQAPLLHRATNRIRRACRLAGIPARSPGRELETFAARKLAVIEHLQQIHQPEIVLRGVIPKMLVASAPEIPCIAAHDFLRRKINASVHRLENVCSHLGKSAVLFPAALALSIGSFFCSRQTQARRTYRRRVRLD
jgi:hypothetical protein